MEELDITAVVVIRQRPSLLKISIDSVSFMTDFDILELLRLHDREVEAKQEQQAIRGRLEDIKQELRENADILDLLGEARYSVLTKAKSRING